MIKENELYNKIRAYYDVDNNEIDKKEINNKGISFLKIRDFLYSIGSIENEDLDNKIYTAIIKVGLFKLNYAVVAIKYTEKKIIIWAYSKEGLLNLHSAKKAINRVVEGLANEEKNK